MKRITKKEGIDLLEKTDLLGLGMLADKTCRQFHPQNIATYVIDRNINYTNVCINKCSFCAFYREKGDPDAYILSKRRLFHKIRETVKLGGTQVLLQGGLHPDLGIDYYVELLKEIKSRFSIHVHGFSPPEICHIADKEGMTLKKTLEVLQQAGLDSLPGGGAEILSDRVRKKISPRKIGKARWLKVMQTAHGLGLKTTATMMFGSLEQREDIIEHLEAIRNLQDKTQGFTAFIPWSFQPGNTELGQEADVKKRSSRQIKTATAVEYLRVLALSRIYLDNIPNIQASWVTQGIKLAQVALRFGANDFGSTMIEENVVASAGVKFTVPIQNIVNAVREAGFKPVQRDLYYNPVNQLF